MEQTFELIRQSQAGDKEAKEQLIMMHSGLIWNVVRRFMGRGYETEDLYQIGAIGLIRAIDKFDFDYDVNCGIGEVVIGNSKHYGMGNHHKESHHHGTTSSTDYFYLDCGIGCIRLDLE